MRYSERSVDERTVHRTVSEVDAEPKPPPAGTAMLMVFLLSLGLWAVIWGLAAALR
jgi:cell division septal protein FtsQ